MEFLLILAIASIIVISYVITIVPQQQAWIVERFGKFDKVLEPGLNLLVPVVQKVAYKHTLKEQAMDVKAQTAISKDNVTLLIDGVLYVKILDPKAASYGVDNPYFAITQLAQTTMRSEIGKIVLDKTFEERESLNTAIVNSINEAASSWGIQCMRYEIKDIKPPETILEAMELQVAADRKKRAEILQSEGKRQSQINIAEADKAQVVLSSEAALTDQVNRAKGEAEAIVSVASANATSIELVAAAIKKNNGSDAVAMELARRYIEAFEKLAKETNTLILPANAGDVASTISQAIATFGQIQKTTKATNK